MYHSDLQFGLGRLNREIRPGRPGPDDRENDQGTDCPLRTSKKSSTPLSYVRGSETAPGCEELTEPRVSTSGWTPEFFAASTGWCFGEEWGDALVAGTSALTR